MVYAVPRHPPSGGSVKVLYQLKTSQEAADCRGNASEDIIPVLPVVRAKMHGMGVVMEWEAPAFEEVSLSCEINSYVNAEL